MNLIQPAGVSKEQLVQICEYGKEFLSRVIDVLQENEAPKQEPAARKKPIAENKALEAAHKKVLSYTKVNYPTQNANEYGRILIRQKENRPCFVFKPGTLEKILLENEIDKTMYLRYARETGKLATNTVNAYTITAMFDRKSESCHAVYLDSLPEPVFSSKDEEVYSSLIKLFTENEPKFDRRGQNSFGRRLSVNSKTCYAVREDVLPNLISSFGGSPAEFIQWAKDNGRLVTDRGQNTVSVDFFNKPTNMYGVLRV